ncbi:hypothetical protein F4780DRAFT_791379 [Xylariomycetidae sp. FL0641]|nr:hypothetical protein F4780DRAFT_791379 [Xylariomycetidae sp. FL0641]
MSTKTVPPPKDPKPDNTKDKPSEKDKEQEPKPRILMGRHIPDYPLHYKADRVRHPGLWDNDKRWGPLVSHAKEAKEKKLPWEEFSFDSFWEGIPKNVQERPNGLWGKDECLPSLKEKADGKVTGEDNENDNNAVDPLTGKKREGQGPKQYDIFAETRQDASPSCLDFEQIFGQSEHPNDYTDNHYRRIYRTLLEKTVEFVDLWFGGDIDLDKLEPKPASGWEIRMTAQFVEYARLVAHEDRPRACWKDIMNKPRERKWLIVGILGQIYQKRIWTELLFGAPDWYKGMLQREDYEFKHEDGFARKSRRAISAHAACRGRLIPENFWAGVDELTAQTAVLFAPLVQALNLVRRPWTLPANPFTTRLYWQDLHSLVAFAAYFQVCTAVSPTVFHTLAATPGARMDYTDEQQVCYATYRESKAAHDAALAAWRAAADAELAAAATAARARLDPEVTSGALTRDQADQRLAAALKPRRDAHAAEEYRRLRGARVHFAVFPKLARYKAEFAGPEKGRAAREARERAAWEERRQALRVQRELQAGGAEPTTTPAKVPCDVCKGAKTAADDATGLTACNACLGTGEQEAPPPPPEPQTFVPTPSDRVTGQRQVDLFRTAVIYYQGLMYPAPGQDDAVPLDIHLNTVAAGGKRTGAWLRGRLGLARPLLAWGWDDQGAWTVRVALCWLYWRKVAAVAALLWALGLAAALARRYDADGGELYAAPAVVAPLTAGYWYLLAVLGSLWWWDDEGGSGSSSRWARRALLVVALGPLLTDAVAFAARVAAARWSLTDVLLSGDPLRTHTRDFQSYADFLVWAPAKLLEAVTLWYEMR